MITHSEYLDIIKRLSKISYTSENLNFLKAKYKSVIASRRAYERLNTVNEFIKILEKRDVINEENLHILEEIAAVAGRQDILQPIHQLPELPANPSNMFDRITNLIGREIGHKWKDFARELEFREGEIDGLEMKHRDISDRVRDILNYYQNNCPSHLLKTNLLKALIEARRKDLSYDVATLMDNYNAGYLRSY